MRVVFLDFGREMRGGQRQVLYLSRHLVRTASLNARFRPLLACPKGSALLEAARRDGVPTLELPGRRWWDLRNILALRRVLAAEPAAENGPAVLLHTNDAHAASLGAFLARRHPGTLLLHTRRVSYPLHPGPRSAKYRQADAVAAVSAEIGRRLVEGGVARERVRVIHSGIDPARYGQRTPRNDGRTVFVAVGALTPQKGYAVLLQAMACLSAGESADRTGTAHGSMPPFEVRIVGEGPLLPELSRLAKKLDVDRYLAFLGRQDAAAILPQCDILLCTSVDGEGSSAAIKEGWAAHLPVIASALPSNLELVEPDTSGLTYPADDPAALARRMRQLALDANLAAALVRGGAQRLLEFTDHRMAAAYVAWYEELALGRA